MSIPRFLPLCLIIPVLNFCAIPGLARAAEPAATAAPPAQKACDLNGRYRVALTLQAEYGGNLCPQRKLTLEFSIRDVARELSAKLTNQVRALKMRSSPTVEILRNKESACGFELHVFSDNKPSGDAMDTSDLVLTMRCLGTVVEGTGTFERAVTAAAGNATLSRSEQCSMQISAKGDVAKTQAVE